MSGEDFLNFLNKMEAQNTFEERIVGKTWVDGLEISTVWANDLELFETAVNDVNDWYPIERYDTKDDALRGHEKWCEMIIGMPALVEIETPGISETRIVKLNRYTMPE